MITVKQTLMQSFEQAGYSTQEFVGEELQTVDAQGNVVEDGMDE